MQRNSLKFLAGAGLALLSVAAAAGPFIGSRDAEHATLYLNVDQTAKQLYPVEIWAVDGKLTNRDDQGVLWIKPGEYTFDVRVSRDVNLATVPGLQHSSRYGQQEHKLTVTVEAGKGYYIGAKFTASGKWEPQVWKTVDTAK
ncbi:MAG TPA: hypothetical protein VFM15_05030 [Gammaproteobacteria bacterium]|nr:hypothetical protein [Gammaproteobacteria bacterium]